MELCVLFIFIDCFALVFIVVFVFFLSLFFLFFYRKFYNDGTIFIFFCFPQKHTSSYLHMHEKKLGYLKKKKNFFWWVDFIISLEQSSVIYLFLIYQVFFLFFFFWQISQVWEKKRKANKTKTFPIFLQNLKMSWDCINYWKFVYIFNA